jgi:TPR repeat protein
MTDNAIVDRVINPSGPWKLPRVKYRVWQPNYARSAQFIKALLAHAEDGDAEAEYELACYFTHGCKDLSGKTIVKHSVKFAAELTRRAALRGLPSAQLALSTLLEYGRGLERDPAQALVWLKKAARAGNGSAANNIAIMYRENGKPRLAVQWFRMAVESGDDDALIQLGVHEYWGIGVRADHRHAVASFKRATKSRHITEAGRDDAFFYLGVAYLEGKGIRQSSASAIKMLERANRDNDHPAAARLIKQLSKIRT